MDDMSPRRTGSVPTGRFGTLTDLLGRPVRTHDGAEVGRLEDVSIHLGMPHPDLERLLVRPDRHTSLMVPWSAVHNVTDDAIVLTNAPPCGAPEPGPPDLAPAEILLRRDVLDTQVVDLQGQRLSRVAEVVLVERDDGSPEVAAVRLGLMAILPRLGLGSFVRHHSHPAVDWQDLHLTSPRAHTVQLATETAGYRQLDAGDLAELLARLSTGNAAGLLRAIDPERAATAVHRSHPLTAARLLKALGPEEATPMLATLPPRVRADATVHLAQPPALHHRRFRRTSGWRRLPPLASSPPAAPGTGPTDRSDGDT
ncbi:mgtE domain protein [Janibacter sp. HTCC2649]|nr:mgtE domain protein [Janibacter sp. HTCC2649]